MEEKVENKNFFKKIWYSITKFEQYPSMAAEGFGRAIKYLIFLTAIVTLFIMIGSLLQMKELIGNLAQYVQDNIPEFSYEQGKLSMENEEIMVIDDMEDTVIDRIVISTNTETDEQKKQIENDNSINGITLFLFNNEIVLKTKLENNQEVIQPYTYSDFIAGYIGENVERFNKTEFVEYLKNGDMTSFCII